MRFTVVLLSVDVYRYVSALSLSSLRAISARVYPSFASLRARAAPVPVDAPTIIPRLRGFSEVAGVFFCIVIKNYLMDTGISF